MNDRDDLNDWADGNGRGVWNKVFEVEIVLG